MAMIQVAQYPNAIQGYGRRSGLDSISLFSVYEFLTCFSTCSDIFSEVADDSQSIFISYDKIFSQLMLRHVYFIKLTRNTLVFSNMLNLLPIETFYHCEIERLVNCMVQF